MPEEAPYTPKSPTTPSQRLTLRATAVLPPFRVRVKPLGRKSREYPTATSPLGTSWAWHTEDSIATTRAAKIAFFISPSVEVFYLREWPGFRRRGKRVSRGIH